MIAFFYFLLDFGDLLFMRRWYSSCAWLMPLSPVTVPAVTKGSSNRSLRRAMVSLKSLLSWTITCGWLCAKAIGAVIDLDTSAPFREPIVFVRCA